MRGGFLVAVFAGVALALGTGVAHAGCPNTCDIEVAPEVVDPAMSCAEFSISGHECDCGLHVVLHNDCSTDIEAVDFEFNSCGGPPAGSTEREPECTIVPAGGDGVLRLCTTGNGHKEWSLQLRHDGTDHTLRLTADVSSFDDSTSPLGCSYSRGRGQSLGFVLGALLSSWIARRRREIRTS